MRSLVELLAKAPELTTGELAAAIARLAIALDPEWVRRRYERALRGRRVVGKRNPDGTGTLTGHDLPADEVAAACAHLDALARAAKAAGHPGPARSPAGRPAAGPGDRPLRRPDRPADPGHPPRHRPGHHDPPPDEPKPTTEPAEPADDADADRRR